MLVAVDAAKEEARIPDVRTSSTTRTTRTTSELGADLQDQLDRAVTNAFSRSFLAAAILGLLALIPILIGRRDVSV